ncbi:MAG TPA: mevalonate kinase, partial [Myxococcota bacterium]|nr:mevalonate kinase [Myxococcota bacterium]
MIEARGAGHGKLILVGEHAVVHGQPAIAFAVDLQTEVTARPNDGPLAVRSELVDELVARAAAAAFGDRGWDVEIRSTLPLGRGMGSSAALSVALVRAASAARGAPAPDGDALFREALALERIFHANPSGLDVAEQ